MREYGADGKEILNSAQDMDFPAVKNNTSLIASAKSIATSAHEGQRYGAGPYTDHLAAVEQVLIEFGHGEDHELRAAAWLHDVLEDTGTTTFDLIANGIPIRVIVLVDAVTDQSGKNRAERHLLTYPRIALIPDAVTLKLADRLANVRASATERRPELLNMYAQEHPEFIAAMPYRACDEEMRRELGILLMGMGV